MTSRVYKYELNPGLTTGLPSGAEILHVNAQDGPGSGLFAWALVDPDAPPDSTRQIVVVGTGHELPDGNLRHINTFLIGGGSLVFHAFEVTA